MYKCLIFVFLKMNKLKSFQHNYTTPGRPMSKKELVEMIKQAEKNTFHSLDTVKQKIQEWNAAALAKAQSH